MNVGYHHLLHRYKYRDFHPLQNARFKSIVDRSVYISGFLGVAVIIPQIVRVWIEKDATGVSLITWVGFFIASSFWLFYGFVHKEKPIILTNLGLITADLLVIIGLLFK